jgi:hypothetical protein
MGHFKPRDPTVWDAESFYVTLMGSVAEIVQALPKISDGLFGGWASKTIFVGSAIAVETVKTATQRTVKTSNLVTFPPMTLCHMHSKGASRPPCKLGRLH